MKVILISNMARTVSTIVLFLIIAIATKRTEGIRCWVCDGKNSLKECHAQFGGMQTCPNPDDVCQNDYRTARGLPIITKGCKQKTACDTEVKQNKDKNQCGRKAGNRNMVCRCCCGSNGCNSKESGCLPPPAPCKKIKAPLNGQSFCPKEISFGSQCNIRCLRGYRRIGPQRAVCVRLSKGSKKGRWNPTKPTRCEKIIVKCNPAKVAPENGYMTCDNSKEYARFEEYNYEGSRCEFQCQKNYYLKGKKNSVCVNTGVWNNESPTCVKGQCDDVEADPNRIESCSDGYNFGSTCTFSCKNGYNMIGNAESSCQQSSGSSRGYWSKTFPVCAQVFCSPKLTNPANGKVLCSKGNVKGSICIYSCDEGYDMDGTAEYNVSAVCRDDGDGDALGEWSRGPATCSRIRCQPGFTDPSGGQVTCTDADMFGSECAFSCNSDHDLTGTFDPTWVSVCQDDGDGDAVGKWSETAADCKEITCQPEFVAEDNERITCTKGNGRNSVCTFTCEEDSVLDVTTTQFVTSECVPPKNGTAIGTWSRREKPGCVRITCPRMPFPDNGFRICSTYLSVRGTFCVFYCQDGYDRVGQSYTMCQRSEDPTSPSGKWTAPAPTCRLGQCPVPKFDKETVIENCDPPDGFKASEYRVGSVCTYTCKSGSYYMVPNIGFDAILSGQVTTECDVNKQWTVPAPRCIKKTCLPQLAPPQLGYPPKCTNGNDYGSRCTFACQEKHAPSHDRPLVCEDDGDNDPYGKWSEEAPICKRSHCDEFGTVINGKLNCSDGTKIGSVCALTCIDRYTVKRYEETECLPSVEWSQRRFFCCVPCLFNRRLKIATAIDRSAIKTAKDFNFLVDFTRSYLKLMLEYRLDVTFSAFTYTENVDLDTAIDSTRLRSLKDVDPMIERLQKMKYRGESAATGKALEYINEVVYGRWDRWREHFVVLVTGGKSTDEVIEISKTMRDRGIGILATGIDATKAGRQELLKMTGTERNVFVADKLEDMRHVPVQIFEISRATGCTSASKTQSCP